MRFPAAMLLLTLLLALGTAGCATPLTEQEVEAQLERAGQPFAALGPRRIIPIYAESKMVAVGLLTEARTDPHSAYSVRLGHKLARAYHRHFHVVVGGPYPSLTDRVLANALQLNQESGLQGLTVVFVSNEQPSAELADAARLAHARLYHRELP